MKYWESIPSSTCRRHFYLYSCLFVCCSVKIIIIFCARRRRRRHCWQVAERSAERPSSSSLSSSCHLNDSLKVISFLKTFFSRCGCWRHRRRGLAPYQPSEPVSCCPFSSLSLFSSSAACLPAVLYSTISLHFSSRCCLLFNLLGVCFFNSLSYFWLRFLAASVSLPLCVNPSQRQGHLPAR